MSIACPLKNSFAVRQKVRYDNTVFIRRGIFQTMKIWIARHGQTRFNKQHLMQGTTDEPLNETGIRQAEEMRKHFKDIRFDAVYSSPLKRAVVTGSILSGLSPEQIVTDERLTEVHFGSYELKYFYHLGPKMSLYWALPEMFPAPEGVETVSSMVERSSSFLRELEQKDYETVLISCHGGIMRALSGYLMDRPNGIYWRPKPKNCEMRLFEAENGRHRLLRSVLPDEEA